MYEGHSGVARSVLCKVGHSGVARSVLCTVDTTQATEEFVGVRLRLKCDGTRAEIILRLSAKRTSPFKSAEWHQFSRLLAQPRCAYQR